MNKRKLFAAITLAATAIAPAAIAVSCTRTPTDVLSLKDVKLNSTFNNLKFSEYQKVGSIFDKKITKKVRDASGTIVKRTANLWEWFRYAEGEIVKVSDGDTVTVRITKQPYSFPGETGIKLPNKVRVRIPFIDTLEEHGHGGVEIDPEEKRLALQDHEYAEKLLPEGSKVRLIADSWTDASYDRVVASLFIGEGFQKNFSVEMLAGGYTLPRLNDSTRGSFTTQFDDESKINISSYMLPFLAYAYNEGIYEKRGFYKSEVKDPYQLATKYKSHGEGIIETGRYLLSQYYVKRGSVTEQNNIFKWLLKKLSL